MPLEEDTKVAQPENEQRTNMPMGANLSAATSPIIPTMGRVVKYFHPGSADGVYPPSESPAIIQSVNEDGTINLFVMSNTGGIFFAKNAIYGKNWDWLNYTKATATTKNL